MLKRIMTIIAISAMMVATACGGTTETTPAAGAPQAVQPTAGTSTPTADTNAVEELPVIHFVSSGTEPNDLDFVLTHVNQALVEQGYEFQITMTFVTEYWTNVALMIAAGETIDLANAHMSTLPGLAAQGVYQPIQAYFDTYAPYLASVMPASARAQGSISGVLYAVPRLIPMAQFNWIMDIRGDMRQEWGFPEIDSIELFEDFLRHAQSEGIMGMPPINFRSMYAHYANFFFPLGDNAMYPIFIDPKDPTHTVRSFFDSEYFRNVVETRRRWVEEDLVIIETDRFGGDAGPAFNHGMLVALGGNLLTQSERTEGFHAASPNGFIETITFNPHYRYIFQGGDNMIGVGSTSNNVKEAVQMINWIRSSQENYDLWTHGIYGHNYELTPTGAITLENISDELRFNPRVWLWNDIDRARFSQHMPTENLERLRNWDQGAIQSPYLGFTVDTSGLTSEFMLISGIMFEFMPIFEQALVSYDDIIDEFMTQLWDAGLQNVIDQVQDQLNAFMA